MTNLNKEDEKEIEQTEIKKAEFYYNAIAHFDESSTKAYERNNAKINVFIGVLSTVIPILTGVGYLTLTNMSTISFFIFYLISLSVLVIALAKCVHLLAPKWFSMVETGEIMKDNDKEKASFIMFQVTANWEDCIKENVRKVNKLYSGLKLVVRLTIVGLIGLILAFSSLGIEYFLVSYVTTNEPYMSYLYANDWRLVFFSIMLVVFVFLVLYILKFTSSKDEGNLPHKEKPTGNQ